MASGYTNTVVITRSNHKHYTNIIPGKKNCIVLVVTLDPCPKGLNIELCTATIHHNSGGFTGDLTPKKN